MKQNDLSESISTKNKKMPYEQDKLAILSKDNLSDRQHHSYRDPSKFSGQISSLKPGKHDTSESVQ